MANKRKVGNPLALAVLSYLTMKPMHPYELSRTLRDNGDARSIKFNHGSLYMVVQQLARAGFIAEQETSREGQRPERTIYAITATRSTRRKFASFQGRIRSQDLPHEPAQIGRPRQSQTDS